MVVDRSTLAATARLFSSAVFHQLAKKGKSPMFARLVGEIGRERFMTASVVSEVFDLAFNSISSLGQRNEYVYKTAITKKVFFDRHDLRTASMLTEVRVDGKKADVVILNDTSTVYEIKSERDSLSRLSSQLESFRRAFASVNVMSSPVHLDQVKEIAPRDVGIMVLNRRGQIREVRNPIPCPERINSESLFSMLQVQESIQVLKMLGITVPEVPNTERFKMVHDLFVRQKSIRLNSATVEVLKKTRSRLMLEEFLLRLPSSLQAAALSTSIRKSDQSRLISALETPYIVAEHWA